MDAGGVDHVENCIDVAVHGPAHREDVDRLSNAAFASRLENASKGDAVAFRRNRERHVHDVDADLGEQSGKRHLLIGRKCDARHLFAVPERIVVHHDRRRIRKA